MTDRSVPLQTFGPPPTYGKNTQQGPEAVHNHYYSQNETTPWYRRKWVLYVVAVALVFIIVAAGVILGVVLKLELGKKSGDPDAQLDTSTRTELTSSMLTPATTLSESATLSTVSSTSSSKPLPTTSNAVQSTATPFTMLEKSQLASVYIRTEDSAFNRRLLIRQEDTNTLLVTEWAEDKTDHYRITDRLGSLPAEPKFGTPLALQVDEVGTVHLFYLSRSNIVSYLYESSFGNWKPGEISNEHGAIRTSAYSSLSTAWHREPKTPGLLVLAYESPSQVVQLAITDTPADRNSWYTADAISIKMDSVPGQSNVPCYSLGGDWFDKSPEKNNHGLQYLLLVAAEADKVVPWECSVDFWPPPDAQIHCNKSSDHFRDGKGEGLSIVPPPKQFSWINHKDDSAGADQSASVYDFTLLSLAGDDKIHETYLGAGVTRGTGTGFAANMPIRAVSTTNEGVVFVSSGKDIYAYRKQGSRWQPDTSINAAL